MCDAHQIVYWMNKMHVILLQDVKASNLTVL